MGDIQPLFQGQTAWFSSSVPKSRIKLWREHGGLIEDFDHAQFVFSLDAETPDTKRIFSSEAYIDEHLAVFHALYVSDCVSQKDTSKVPLGQYFLPPKELHDMIKRQKKFRWESENGVDNESTNSSDEEVNDLQATSSSQNRDAIHFNGEEYLSIQKLGKVTGELEDFVPGNDGYEVYSKTRKT